VNIPAPSATAVQRLVSFRAKLCRAEVSGFLIIIALYVYVDLALVDRFAAGGGHEEPLESRAMLAPLAKPVPRLLNKLRYTGK
jgi:hypothetical protein